MNQATRLAVGSFILLMTLVGVSGAAEQQFSCKGQVIQGMPQPTGQPPSPIDLNVSLDSKRKMSLKIGDGKPTAANVTSNNKLQLKFRSSLFLLYNSGQLARLNCTRI
jgi:hypothetical protein